MCLTTQFTNSLSPIKYRLLAVSLEVVNVAVSDGSLCFDKKEWNKKKRVSLKSYRNKQTDNYQLNILLFNSIQLMEASTTHICTQGLTSDYRERKPFLDSLKGSISTQN